MPLTIGQCSATLRVIPFLWPLRRTCRLRRSQFDDCGWPSSHTALIFNVESQRDEFSRFESIGQLAFWRDPREILSRYFLSSSSFGSTSATSPNFVFPLSAPSIPYDPELLRIPARSSCSSSLPFTVMRPLLRSPHVSPLFAMVNEPTGFPWSHSSTSPNLASGFL